MYLENVNLISVSFTIIYEQTVYRIFTISGKLNLYVNKKNQTIPT